MDAWGSSQCVKLGAGMDPRETPLLSRHGHWKCGLLNSLVNPNRVHNATSTPIATKTPPTRKRVARLDEKKHVYINATRKESILWQVKKSMAVWIPSTNTYDHISRAYGKAYKIARGSRPHVLCVTLPKNFACIKWDSARRRKSNETHSVVCGLATLSLTNKHPRHSERPQNCYNGYIARNLGDRSIFDHIATTVNTRNGQKCHICVEENNGLWYFVSTCTHGCESKAAIQWW